MKKIGIVGQIVKIGFLFGVVGILYSCSGNNYQMNRVEKENLKGFHHNQAKKIVDNNEANKQANKKAADEFRAHTNEELNKLNQKKSAPKKHSGKFEFY